MLVHGLITSSSVTAASALMLEDTVLGYHDDKTHTIILLHPSLMSKDMTQTLTCFNMFHVCLKLC